MTDRKRKFPIYPDSPADDESLVYKIFTTPFEGSYLVIGETVFLSDEGIEILAPTDGSFEDQNAYTFRDEGSYTIGGLYAQDDTGENTIAVRALDPSATGDDILIEIQSIADPTNESTAESKVLLAADRDGESQDTFISIRKDDDNSIITLNTTEYTQVKPKLRYIGASDEVCFTYIKGTYFIIKYNDSGTYRYKYLDLSGTGTTWTHSTSEPS